MARKGLGRGLSTLLGDEKKNEEGAAVEPAVAAPTVEDREGTQSTGPSSLPIHLIDPNPYQPRVEMDQEGIEELTQSVRNHGILEPLLVRRHPSDPERFQLIAGERRLRAAKGAELEKVPALVRDSKDLEMMEIAIVENVQRENLNPIEEAEGYRRLIDASIEAGEGLNQETLAKKVGKNRTTIANLFRLLDLPDYVQETIRSGVLSQGHGKILAGLDGNRCKSAWNFVLKEGASVRALEKFLKSKKEKSEEGSEREVKTEEAPDPNDPTSIHLRSIEEALRERFRAKVKVSQKKDQSGTIQINYYNNEELSRILESVDVEL
ncbi:MAG: ParB/RepB/Spo0J family partition protein [Candidatus Omnitrophica bacterium]|nr:ParB/RepB/Spo0J family partition protein [Candidatus Omnitrophota bacterium]